MTVIFCQLTQYAEAAKMSTVYSSRKESLHAFVKAADFPYAFYEFGESP
jgi:hypothetical protein